MDSSLFKIGDVVALKMHPYHKDISDIIISGDHIMLSPLMVVAEVYKSISKDNQLIGFKYRCVWFSNKTFRFIDSDFFEEDIKLIVKDKVENHIPKDHVRRGDRLILKTVALELGKKKSSLSYDGSNSTLDQGNTTITSLLSFLPPTVQVIEVVVHKSTKPTTNKNIGVIRTLPQWDVRFSIFEPSSDKISQYMLPLDIFLSIEELPETVLTLLASTIKSKKYLKTENEGHFDLIRPISISYRAGKYYLNAYNYRFNRTLETALLRTTIYTPIGSPYKAKFPIFNIETNPIAGTADYIREEITKAIESAAGEKAYIRIEYKNRNEKLTVRTIKEYRLVKVTEGPVNVTYLIGFCLLRGAVRNFKVDRIQSLQMLDLLYDVRPA